MLTELKAYSAWIDAPTLPLSETGRAETDLIQVRNISGLNPVKATVNTSPFGSIDGTSYVGSSVLSRNIVLTLHPNPDWDEWSYEGLRRLIYSYFVPKKPTRLVFYSDDIVPVEIFGIVESVEVNMFSKDPEIVVSIICPDPYFSALNPIVITGQCISSRVELPEHIQYNGTMEAGIKVRVVHVADPPPDFIAIQIGNPAITYFVTDAIVTPAYFFEMSSIPTKKYVQTVDVATGVITNILSKAHIEEGSQWPMLQPGMNDFSVITGSGDQDFELTYVERYGGL